MEVCCAFPHMVLLKSGLFHGRYNRGLNNARDRSPRQSIVWFREKSSSANRGVAHLSFSLILQKFWVNIGTLELNLQKKPTKKSKECIQRGAKRRRPFYHTFALQKGHALNQNKKRLLATFITSPCATSTRQSARGGGNSNGNRAGNRAGRSSARAPYSASSRRRSIETYQ